MQRNVFFITLKSTYARLAYILEHSSASVFPFVESSGLCLFSEQMARCSPVSEPSTPTPL